MTSRAALLDILPDLRWRALHACASGIALACVVGWLGSGWIEAWAGSPAAAWVGGLAGAAWGWWKCPSPQGRLMWDGALWHWQPRQGADDLRGQVRVMVDTGGWMLLRLQSPRAVIWLPLAHGGCDLAWAAARGVLHGPRPRVATDAAPGAR